jgi:DNA-binding NarL/FixJ family response regulator
VRIIMLSSFGDSDQVRESIAAGARGYVIKRSDIDELRLAIETALRGNSYFSSDLAEAMDFGAVLHAASGSHGDEDPLTGREREILQLTAEGHSSRAIAERLSISARTVEGHRARIMAKLGCRNRTDLVRSALRRGLIELGQPRPASDGSSA